MKKSVLRKTESDNGMVMTEVIIAFLLLTIVFGMLYHCIRFSSQMMGRAADLGRENCYYEEAVAAEFTKKTPADEPYKISAVNGNPKITFTDPSGGTYAVTVKTAKKTIRYKEADLTTEADQKLYLYTY